MDFSNIKAVGFDLDGTLVDSRVSFAKAFSHVISSWGLEHKSIDELTPLVGIHLTELLDELGIERERKSEFLDHIDEIYPGIAESEMKPFEGVIELLQQIKSKGIKVALITSNSSYASKMSLEICGISEYFFDEFINSCNTVDLKPSPEPIKKALEKFNVLPHEFVYFGDTTADYNAAISAGVGFKLLTHYGLVGHGEKICQSHHVSDLRIITHYINKSLI